MAVVFELVLRYPTGSPAVAAVEAAVTGRMVLVRGVPWALRGPYVARLPDYVEVAVAVPGLGSHGPYVPGIDHRTLVRADVTTVGHQLYDLVRELDGYEAALVSYDPEEGVDLDLVRADRADFPDPVPGLVVTEAVRDELGWAERMEPFAPGYWWNPYQGDEGWFER